MKAFYDTDGDRIEVLDEDRSGCGIWAYQGNQRAYVDYTPEEALAFAHGPYTRTKEVPR